MQRGDASDRPKRVVRRHADASSLGHGGYLLSLPQPAAMADIGLDNVDSAVMKQALKLREFYEPLAGRDRNLRIRGDLAQSGQIAGWQNLLDEHRAARGERLNIGQRR